MTMLRKEEAAAVRSALADLERAVELVLVIGPEETPLPSAHQIDYTGDARRLLEELVSFGGGRLSLRVVQQPAYGAERFPAICVLPDGEDVGVRFYGLPWGYELTSIVGACVDAGRLEQRLSEESREKLATLAGEVAIEVFVTPTCPHCPPAVLLAYRLALASPLVRASAVETNEFPTYADAHGVLAVPRISVGGTSWEGAVPERVLVDRVLAAAGAGSGT